MMMMMMATMNDVDDNKQVQCDIFICKFLVNDTTHSKPRINFKATILNDSNNNTFWNMFIFTRRYFQNTKHTHNGKLS